MKRGNLRKWGSIYLGRRTLWGLLIALGAVFAAVSPAFAHPPEIVQITGVSDGMGRDIRIRGQVKYDGDPDGPYFVAWNFGDGSAPEIVVNSEQDAQGYTPWASHTYPRRPGLHGYTVTLSGFSHHGEFGSRSDFRQVYVSCIAGFCVTVVAPPSRCRICLEKLEADLPNSESVPYGESAKQPEPGEEEEGGTDGEGNESETDIDIDPLDPDVFQEENEDQEGPEVTPTPPLRKKKGLHP